MVMRLPGYVHIRIGPVPKGKKCYIVKDVGRPKHMKITAIYTPPKGMSCKQMRKKKAGEFEYIQKVMIQKKAWDNPKEQARYRRFLRKKYKCTVKPGPSRYEFKCMK